MAVIKEIKDKEYKPVIESDSDSESPVISAPTADIPTALHPRHHQDKDSLRQRKGQDSLEKIFKKEDEQKKKQLFKGNAAVMILVVVFLLSCCIPIIEMLTKTYKPAPRPKSNSSGPKNHYTPPEYGNYDSPEPKPDRVVKKAYDLYRVKDLKKLKIKDLKTILWGRSIAYDDLREKKDFINKIMGTVVDRDLHRMTKKELKAHLTSLDIAYDKDKEDYTHDDLIKLFLES